MSEAEKELADAREAWRKWLFATSQVARIRGYTRLTSEMKNDLRRHLATEAESKQTLTKILGKTL